MNDLKLITIDGPSASGKSSVSRLVARKLGWPWVSTGAFYRGLALAAIRKNLDLDDEGQLARLASDPIWKIEMTDEKTVVCFDGEDVTSETGGEKVGAVASQISGLGVVRSALLQRQRDCYRKERGLVAEGRDCGTVVFPGAQAKIYLTARPDLRAMRRSEEESACVEETLEMQKLRDEKDRQRKTAPLRVADGALRIDSSDLGLEEVVEEVLKYAKSQSIPLN